MANWEQIRDEWETTKITLADLADKHDLKLGTLKSRKSREKWSKGAANKKDASGNKKDATKQEQLQPKKKRKKQKNRSGNPNPPNQFTRRNSQSVKHGMFRKYLPDDEETLSIYDDLEETNPLDLLWDNIKLKFAAIIRAQKIMFVQDSNDTSSMLKKEKESIESEEYEWEIQFAWDKQANFLNAQSRAMSTLTAMIRQYEEMVRAGWGDEEQRLRIEKMKAEIDSLNDTTGQEEAEDWVESLRAIAEKREQQQKDDSE